MPELITIARPYAKAAFEFANEYDVVGQWQIYLAFLSDVILDKQLKSLISSDLGAEKLAELILDIAKDQQFDKYISQFVRLLAINKRLNILPDINQLFNEYCLAQQNIKIVDVISAQSLSVSQLEKITQAMEKRLSQKVKLNNQTDSSLISGFIIHVGDMVIDRSIKGRLHDFASTLQS